MNKKLTPLNLITHFAAKSYAEAETAQASLLENKSQASVLIPIINSAELAVLFTERTLHLKHHAGQISFPGGRREAMDSSLEATCLRETIEEIGIAADHIKIIGRLMPVSSASGFTVTPFIGLIDPLYTLTINSDEVAAIFTAPLDFLLDPLNHAVEQYVDQNKIKVIDVIQYDQHK